LKERGVPAELGGTREKACDDLAMTCASIPAFAASEADCQVM
jgi:hypothetical protein